MSNEQADETTAKRPPGRPKGAKTKRSTERAPVHKGAHSSDDDGQDPLDGFEYRPYEQDNPLSIDPDIVRGIEREWGYSLLWVCFECNGKPFPNLVSARKRNGYAEVRRGNFGGALDHLCDKDGRIVREGLVLMARPMEIQRMAVAHDVRAAKAAIENMRRSHAEEGVPVEGGDHPSALAKNRHRQNFEPGPRIPE
jgi:hypothetical protein